MHATEHVLAEGSVVTGWCILAADWVFGRKHDLAKLRNQVAIGEQLKRSWAALDCSDKLRIREIPRQHASGKAMPSPLKSEELPMGLPGGSKGATRKEWRRAMQQRSSS